MVIKVTLSRFKNKKNDQEKPPLSNNDKRIQKFLFLKKMRLFVNLRDKTVTKSRAYSNLYVSELL